MGISVSEWGTQVRRQLPPHPSSAGEARRMVRRLLTDAGRRDLLEPASLLVSEVVTNALEHSGTTIDVSMALRDDGVLVEVGDGSRHMPARRHYAPTASTGRGLALLDETATAWGVVPGVRGKTVWFQVDSSATVDRRVSDRSARRGPSSRCDQVTRHSRSCCSTCRCCCTRPGSSTRRRSCVSTFWCRWTVGAATTRSPCTRRPPTRWRCCRSRSRSPRSRSSPSGC